MLAYTINVKDIKNQIFIPKYYDPELYKQIMAMGKTHDLLVLGDLIDKQYLDVKTGDEIGKMAYGTGNIPFVRTSDFSNWEIKTIPKQGVSEEIYQQYASKEDVQPGDILLVRDGTYLVGTNCIVTQLDTPMLFQSHILKFRILDDSIIDSRLLFLCFNCQLVQRQIRNIQFTADIIDTIGNRYRELILPIPKDATIKDYLRNSLDIILETRMRHKAAIKQMPILIEKVLETNSVKPIDTFFAKSINDILSEIVQDVTALEFGQFSAFTIRSSEIVKNIFLSKYYDPSIKNILDSLSNNCELITIGEMVESGDIALSTGDEIGKMAYGTGNIPFVRTSDFSNWEIKADPKQGVSEEIYQQYASKEDVQPGDILLVRDGTYLVGTSCLITEADCKMLYCGGLIKIRSNNKDLIDEFLLLGLLSSYIVKRQIRTKQFTRDIIDTLGQRLKEVVLPIPKSEKIREAISIKIRQIIENRITARNSIQQLSETIIDITVI